MKHYGKSAVGFFHKCVVWGSAWALTASAAWAASAVSVNAAYNAQTPGWGTSAFATIQAAVSAVEAGGTVTVEAGTYTEPVTLSKQVLLQGAGRGESVLAYSLASGATPIKLNANGCVLTGFEIVKTDKSGTQNLIYVAADDVVVSNCLIRGQYVLGDGDTSRAFEVAYGSSGLLIDANEIRALRQPGYLNGSTAAPTTGTISNNRVSGTRGWVIDGANLVFTGNTWGSGAQANYLDIAILASTPADYYTNIPVLCEDNAGAVVQDQRVSGANLSTAFVDAAAATGGDGTPTRPVQTLSEGLAKVLTGGVVRMAPGTYSSGALTVAKSVSILGANAGKAGADPARSAETRIQNSKLTFSAAAILDGVEIYQTDDTPDAVLVQAGASIRNSVVRRVGVNAGKVVRGIVTAVGTTGFVVERNLFTGDTSGGLFGGHKTWNTGFWLNGGAGRVSDNVFEVCRTAANLDDFNTNVILTGNIFRNCGSYVSIGGTVPVDGSLTIAGNAFGFDFSGAANPTLFNNSNVAATFRLNVVANTFGGIDTASLSDEQKVMLEACIYHRGRNGSKRGIVDFVAGEQVVVATLTTVQSAVDAAAAGQRVLLSAGTHAGDLQISKALTLNGISGAVINGQVTLDSEGIEVAGITLTTDKQWKVTNLASIQSGIDAAGNGERVSIQSGSYTGDIDASEKSVELAVGASPGLVTLDGDLVLTADDQLEIELNGTDPGSATGFDQWVVNGTVTLGGATLAGSLGFTPAVGTAFPIVVNDGTDAVGGTFAGLDEGAAFELGGVTFSITYAGGDGNDVVLTVAAPATVFVDDDFTAEAYSAGVWGYSAFAAVQDGVEAVAEGGVVSVAAGTYNESVYIAKALDVIGAGAASTILDGTGTGYSVVTVNGSSDVWLEGVTVQNGAADDGAGIHAGSAQSLVVMKCVIKNNAASFQGGGLYAAAATRLVDSTLSGNSVPLTGSLRYGGGIFADGCHLELVNVTISGNSGRRGGGLYLSESDAVLAHVTVTANTASTGTGAGGGGMYLLSGTQELVNTLVAGNTAGGVASDIVESGNTRSNAGVLIGGTPLLGSLADNGGPTPTHALLAGSPALNGGVASDVTSDQRGVPRPQGSATDIGAFETVYTAYVDGSYTAEACGGHVWGQDAFPTVQAAINAVAEGGTVNVAAGTFSEIITVNKRVSVVGAGSGPDGTILTAASGDTALGVVNLTASGLSDEVPVLLQNLRISAVARAGLSVGRFYAATGTSVQYVKLDNVKVYGTNTSPSSEQERGLYVDLTSTLKHLVVTGCAFDNLTYGWYIQKQVSADASTVQYVTVSDTSFSHNNHKGVYAEKLSDATFTDCTAAGNGFDGSVLPSYFAPFMCGVDLNLKAGSYGNLVFSGCLIDANALGGAKEGVGITVKARDDASSYNTFPASCAGVLITGCTITGNERGIRIGEPGKNNAGPTGVVIENNIVAGNEKHYAGSDGSAYGGLINMSQATVAADDNFWGDASGPAGSGDDVVAAGAGAVTFIPFYTESALQNHAPYALSLSAATVAENAPAGTEIGTFGTEDVDAGDTFTYALVAGDGADDNAAFVIAGGALKTAAAFDFEAKSSFSIRVRTTDSHVNNAGVFEKTFVVTVTDVEEAPALDPVSNQATDEDVPLAFTVTASDSDGDALTFTWEGVPAGATATAAGAFSWTPAQSDIGEYPLTVTVSDGTGLSDSESFTVTVRSVNDNPTVAGALPDLNKQQDFGPVVIDLAPVFADAENDALAYSVEVAGDPVLLATLDGAQLTLTSVALARGTATVTVTATESAKEPPLHVSDSFTVTVKPVWNTTRDTFFDTIQAAIADASTVANDVITVAAGSYAGTVTLSKGVALRSVAGAAVTTLSGSSTDAVTITANGAEVSGFTINNPNGLRGVYAKDYSNLTVKDNVIEQIATSVAAPSGAVCGVMIYCSAAAVDTVVIQNNVIRHIESKGNKKSANGIWVGDSTGNFDITGLLVQGNQISHVLAPTAAWDVGRGAYGVIINHANHKNASNMGSTVAPQILNNTITDLEGLWAHAIGLEGYTPNALVRGNTIARVIDHKSPADPDAVGVMVEDNAAAATVTITQNGFTDVLLGVRNATPTPVVAGGNYWGGDVPLIDERVRGVVTVDNYYADAALTQLRYWNVYVDDSFPAEDANHVRTIQGGVNAVATYGNVYVASGTYNERVVVEKTLRLVGENAGSTTVNGGGLGVVVTITADGVEMSGFTVTGSGMAGVAGGVGLVDVEGCTLTNIVAQGNLIGIGVVGGSRNVLVGNTLISNGIGITLENLAAVGGAVEAGSVSNRIANNIVQGSLQHGINIPQNCDFNTVEDNTVTGCAETGIYLWKAFGCTVTGNTVNNNAVGIQDFASANATFTDNVVTANGSGFLVRTGVYGALEPAATNVLIAGNTIAGNTAFGLNATNNQGHVVLAAGNYWGAPTGPSGTGFFGQGDAIAGPVSIASYYTDDALASIHYYDLYVDDSYAAGDLNVNHFLTVPDAYAAANPGDTIHVADGAYALPATLVIAKPGLTLTGASRAGVTLDATARTSTAYGIHVSASDVTLEHFTLIPAAYAGAGFPIHVSAAPAILANVTLRDIAISGSFRTPFDVNGVDVLTLDGLVASGAQAGSGIGLSGCAGVTITGCSTAGNAWGGVRVSASPDVGRPSSAVAVNFAENVFGEVNALYVEGTQNTVLASGYSYRLESAAGVSYLEEGVTEAQAVAIALQGQLLTGIEVTGLFAFATGTYVPFGADLSTADVYVDDDWAAATPGMGIPKPGAAAGTYLQFGRNAFATVQAGVGGVDVGGVVRVAAGTYAEQVNINKASALLGPNAGVAGNALRGAEAFIVPPSVLNASGQREWNSTPVVTISAADVVMNGFTVSGDNPLLDGYSYAGMNVEAGRGVLSTASRVRFLNNVVTKFTYMGFHSGGGQVSPHYTGVEVADNRFTEIHDLNQLGYGYALYIQGTAASVTGNTVDNCRTGVQIQPYRVIGETTVLSGNSFACWRNGVFYNYAEEGASPWEITGNTITACVPPVAPTGTVVWEGISAETMRASGNGGTFSGNTVDGAVAMTDACHAGWGGFAHAVWGLRYKGEASLSTKVNFTGNTVANVAFGFVHEAPVNIVFTGNSLSATDAAIRLQRAYSSAGAVQTYGGTNDVDATAGNTINGVDTATATSDQLFVVEDAITHKVDDMTLGLVRVKAGNVYVTQASGSIQRGVHAAVAGDTVNVGEGTFVEQVEIAKDITLDGQGEQTVVKSPAVLALGYTGDRPIKPVIHVHDTAAATLSNFVVDGDGKGNPNNRFTGVSYYQAGGRVQNLVVKAIRNTPLDGVQGGYGIYAYATVEPARELTVTGCDIFDIQKNGIFMSGSQLTASVTENRISGAGSVDFIAQNGVVFFGGATGSILANQFSGFAYTPEGDEACAILVYGAGATVAHNAVIQSEVGVGVVSPTAGMGVITENSFEETVTGIHNYSESSLVAERNWWGSSTGPTSPLNAGGAGAVVTGPVDVSPWLGSEEDLDPAARGFQPSASPVYYLPAALVFSQQPGGAALNATLNSQPVVTVMDEQGQVATQFVGTVSLTLENRPGSGLLSGTVSVTAAAGVASFADVAVTQDGGVGYTLRASASPLTEVSDAFTIGNPPPDLASMAPIFKAKGTAGFVLTVTGSDFVPSSKVLWNGTERPTVYASGTQLTADIPASDLATAGTATVTVLSPTAAASGALTFTITETAQASTVFVDDDWTGYGNCDDHIWGYDAFKTIQEGVNAVVVGGTVNVAAGTYYEDVLLNKTVSVLGAGAGASVVYGPIGGEGATFKIAASGVVLDGFTITRVGNNSTDWNNTSLNSAGVAIQGQSVRGTVRNCVITGNRTGVDINNSNGNVLMNNAITFNRTGLIMRNQTDNLTIVGNEITDNWTVGVLFLDASSGSNSPVQTAANCVFNNNTISGNWYGDICDRQAGGSLPAPGSNLKNFSGNWFGKAALVVSTANSTEPGYSAQIPVAFGGLAVNPGGAPNILGAASANIDYTPWLNVGTDTDNGAIGFKGDFASLWVDDDSAQAGATGRVQEAVNMVTSGGTVNVLAGTYRENVVLTKPVTVTGDRGDVAVAGPGANAPVLDGDLNNDGTPDKGDGFTIPRNTSLSGITVEGFIIQNFGNGGGGNGVGCGVISWENTSSNVTIRDNRFVNNGYNGIYLGTDSDDMQSHWLIAFNQVVGAPYAAIELTDVTDSQVLDNEISAPSVIFDDPGDAGVGIEIAARARIGTVTTANIDVRRNVITGVFPTGSRAGINLLARAYNSGSADARLSGITVEANVVTGTGTRGIDVVAESRNGKPSLIENLAITQNALSGNEIGIDVGDAFAAPKANGTLSGSTITISNNSLASSATAGLRNQSGAALIAENNWWGSLKGPTHALNAGGNGATVSNGVDFSPWLGDGTDSQDTVIGFQPNAEPVYYSPKYLVFSAEPADTALGAQLEPQPVVTVMGENAAPALQFSGLVTLALGSNPGLGALAGTTNVACQSGVATFTDLALTVGGGSGLTLAASSAYPIEGATSAAFDVANPAPKAVSLSPYWTHAGAGDVTVTITGADFVPTSAARWDRSGSVTALQTTFLSDSQLSAVVPAALVETAGTADIYVVTPGAGGGESARLQFRIEAAQPTVVYVDDDYVALENDALVAHDMLPGWLAIKGYDAFATIQEALDAVAAGGTVHVAAGDYIEDLTADKPVQLLGPNAAISPNGGSREDEAILYPATSAPDPNTTGRQMLYVATSGVVVKGFLFNGDNPALTSGILAKGADVDACEAIASYEGVGNVVVENNILCNISYAAIDLYNWFNQNATSGNAVRNNRIENVGHIPYGFGIGVLLYNNCYAVVENNVMADVRLGVQTGNFFQPDPGDAHAIRNNSIAASRRGVFHNLQYSAATDFVISGNTFTAVDEPGASRWDGVLLSSLQGTVGALVENNTVTVVGPISQPTVGYHAWSTPTTGSVTIRGGSVSGALYGVQADNFDGYNSNAETTRLTLEDVSITGAALAGVYIKDNTNSTHNAVHVLLTGATAISGCTDGVLLEGGSASASFSGASISAVSRYIGLTAGATNSVDATVVSLDGLTGAAMTLAQLLAAEDKITHQLDDASLGFVRVKAGEVFVTQASGSIQRGIDASAPGDTVHVAAGTFTEQVEIASDITLLGAGAATIIQSPAVMTLSYMTSAANKPVVHVHNTASAAVRDLTVDGAGRGNANYRFMGVSYYRAGGLISNVVVTGVRDTPFSGAQHGNAIYAYADAAPARVLDVVGCRVSDFQKNGITMNGAFLTANVVGNRVTCAGATSITAQNGIQFGFGSTGSVRDNEVSGGDYTGSGWSAAGVLVYQSGVAITGNKVSACQSAVNVTGPLSSMGMIANNDLSGNEWGLWTDSGVALCATGNWWGTANGPLNGTNAGGEGSAVGGAVDFSPWLASGTDTDAAIGFQPSVAAVHYLPAGLVFTVQPGGAALGSALSAQPVVTVTNEIGEVATQFNGAVTLGIGLPNPGAPVAGVLSGGNIVVVTNGVAVFGGLSITQGSGDGYALVASAEAPVVSAISDAFGIANNAPQLAAIGNQSVDEEVELTFTASATDLDAPPQELVFSLVGAPAGAQITAGGVFTWTPTEEQGNQPYTFTVVVTDNGGPAALSDSETITVTVNEVNVAPVLDAVGNKSVDEEKAMTFTATASDHDLEPKQTLRFSLAGEPAGAAIDPVTGVFTWTPSEAQGGASYTFDVVVTDDGVNADSLFDSEAITVTVAEVNVAPELGAIPAQSVNFGQTLTFTATATDQDDPAQTLTFGLSGAPEGAAIDPETGVFTWTPTEAQAKENYSFTVTVTDDGDNEAGLSDSQTVTIGAVSAAHSCTGYRSPSTTLAMVVSNSFAFAGTPQGLTWTPVLPNENWVITGADAGGNGVAEVQGGAVVFTTLPAVSPAVFTYTVSVPGDQAVSNSLGAAVSFNNLTADVAPIAIFRYHSADYRRDPSGEFAGQFRRIDSTEVNRVLAYWRFGYKPDAAGYDGFVAVSGYTGLEAVHHSADTDKNWRISTVELMKVQGYWRANGYHIDLASADGYANNRVGTGPSYFKTLQGFPKATLEVPSAYNPGESLQMNCTFDPAGTAPLALGWTPSLPEGWVIESVSGDGAPELANGEIVCLGAVLPSTPVKLVLTVRVPLTENRAVALGGAAQVLADGKNDVQNYSVRAASLTPADGDGNGMADAWERVFAGSAGSLDPAADLDGDTLSNFEEYLCGTVPTDAASVLKMVSIQPQPDGKTRISWTSVSGRVYLVQRADGSPAAASFKTIKADLAADPSGRNVCVDEADRSQPRFYRVLLQD